MEIFTIDVADTKIHNMSDLKKRTENFLKKEEKFLEKGIFKFRCGYYDPIISRRLNQSFIRHWIYKQTNKQKMNFEA